MSYSKGPARIALTTFEGRSVTMEAYDSIEELLSARFESSMGIAAWYGHPEHIAAMQRLHEKLGVEIEKATAAAELEAKESERDWGGDDESDEPGDEL